MANKIVIGLAPLKKGFYDPKTNISLSLDKSIREINFNESTDLSGIAHGLLCQKPAIVLYEGELPLETVEAWRAKYKNIAPQAITRSNEIAQGDVFAEPEPEAVSQQADMFEAASFDNTDGDGDTDGKDQDKAEDNTEEKTEDDKKDNTNQTQKTSGRGRGGRRKKTQTDSE